MRKRRLLLAATALSAACSKAKPDEPQPLPGNPKGSVYDAALEPQPVAPTPPDAAIADAVAPADAAMPKVPADAPVIRPLPGNPKGSRYDGGLQPTKPKRDPAGDL